MKRAIACVLLMLLCNVPAGAQDDAPDAPRPLGLRERGGEGSERRPWRRRDPVDDEASWDAAQAFFREYSPNRFAMFDDLPEDNPRRGHIRRFVTGRYLMMQELKKRDEKLYDTRLKQIQLEDTIFDLVRQVNSTELNDEERETARKELRQNVVLWVDASLAERKLRLEKLEAMIEQEKLKLDKDEQARDALIEKRYNRAMSAGAVEDPMGPPPGRGGRGPREGSPGLPGAPDEAPPEEP